MKTIFDKIRQITFDEKSAPLAFLAACLFAFGLLIPNLGFYMDDWPYVFYAFNKGIPSLGEMLIYDSRPNAAWLYMLGFRILGFTPLAWHIASLLMRWLTVTLMWILLRAIWQERKKETLQTALLFAVYPFFMLQPFAVGSTHHWFGFLTFNLSLLLMVWSMQKDKYKIPLILASMSLEAVHLFTSEYFAGLELIRPIILWILIARAETDLSKRSVKTLLNWLPYILVLMAFAYWRVAIYENPPDVIRNEPVLVYQLMSAPFKAVGQLLATSIKDAYSVLSIGWQKATDVELLDAGTAFPQFRLAVSAVSFAFAYFYLSRLDPQAKETSDDWKKGSTSLAIFSLLVGGLPVWLIGRSIVESKNLLSASRFGIPAMFGASLLVFLITDWLFTETKKKLVVLSLLLALSVNFHIANTKEFQYSWEKQNRLMQQLIWRAPNVTPGTAFLTDEEILGVMGEYAVSFEISTAYQPKDVTTPPYWYFPFYYTNPNVDDLLQGVPLEYDKLTMHFRGNSKQMLLLSFNPEMNRCLWILQPQDKNLRLVSDDMRKLASGSNVSLIQQGDRVLPEDIFGKTKNRGWCYYFEKADLARQYGQWDEVARLWKEAQAQGERPDNGFEYIPFIEGLGHTGDWAQVKEMTKFAKRITAGLEPSLCGAMDRLAASTSQSQERDDTVNALKDDLKCVNYQ